MRSLPQDLWSADDGLRDGIGLERGPAAAPKEKSRSTHLFRLHRVQRRSIQSHGELAEQQGRPVRSVGAPSGLEFAGLALGGQHPRAVRRVQVGDRRPDRRPPRRARASSTPIGPDRRARSARPAVAPGSAAGSRPSTTGRRSSTSSPPGTRSRQAPGCGVAVGASMRSSGGRCRPAQRPAAPGVGAMPGGGGKAGSVRGGGVAHRAVGFVARRGAAGISPGGGTMKSGDSTPPL